MIFRILHKLFFKSILYLESVFFNIIFLFIFVFCSHNNNKKFSYRDFQTDITTNFLNEIATYSKNQLRLIIASKRYYDINCRETADYSIVILIDILLYGN